MSEAGPIRSSSGFHALSQPCTEEALVHSFFGNGGARAADGNTVVTVTAVASKCDGVLADFVFPVSSPLE